MSRLFTLDWLTINTLTALQRAHAVRDMIFITAKHTTSFVAEAAVQADRDLFLTVCAPKLTGITAIAEPGSAGWATTDTEKMEYYTLLFFGCFVGMQHALEADHLAAMAALSTRQTSRHALVLRGSVWGLGHTVTLLTICGILLVLGGSISPRAAAFMEFSVGTMIVLLGANVLYKLWRRRAHFHFHRHEHGLHHLHIHSHADDAGKHSDSAHDHGHRDLGLGRSLVVGMMHGAAGSAALLVFAATADSLIQAAAYILSFGAGSIIGMAALSFAASYPLRLMENYAVWLNKITFACIGCAAMIIGVSLMSDSWEVL